MSRPTAIAYMRSDISGGRQEWEETQMRSLAKRLGYNLTKTIVFSHATTNRVQKLLSQVNRDQVDAVLVPDLDHLEGGHNFLPERVNVVASADEVYACWPPLAAILGRGHRLPQSQPPIYT